MVNIGQMNRLRVIKAVDFGVYLDAGFLGEVLLPKREVPADSRIGDALDVFLYYDSDDRPIATTLRPKAMVGQCALLRCVAVNQTGAFLDWGLMKDLMVPFAEQAQRMQAGSDYLVFVYINERDDRIVASSKLENHLRQKSPYHKAGQAVELVIAAETDLGYKAVIDQFYLGLLFKGEVFQPLEIGSRLPGFIKAVRPDGKLDLCLQMGKGVPRDDLAQQILDFLKVNGGSSTLCDKSPPEAIYRQFRVSKAAYKRALGGLLKQGLITLSAEKVTLVI